jgi:cardiolipin synthase
MLDWPVHSLQNVFFNLFDWIYLITLIGVIIVVLLDNRDPAKTISWILVLVFLPYIGLILYFFFGQRFRKQKIVSKKSIQHLENNPACLYEETDPSQSPPECVHLIELLRKNNAHLLFSGNEVRLLTNGKVKFEAFLDDIYHARKHIHLVYYIFYDDQIGKALQQLLIQKAEEGVEVRVIYDDFGSWRTRQSFFKEMKAAGVQVYPFMKVLLPFLSPKFNFRNHRKIAVIDGEIGYVGGMNVADRYLTGGHYPHWRDTDIRVRGKGVYGLQTAFLIDWFFVSRQKLTSKYYFPDIKIYGHCLLQTATSGPDTDWQGIYQAISSVITRAREYVYLQSPYFLPDENLLTALQVAALSGVDVRLMVPRKTDSLLAVKAMESHFQEVMDAGVKVYQYHTGFLHAKTLVADDLISSVGSTNLDYRSFDLNFEINEFIYDKEFALQMKAVFLKDLEQCEKLDPVQWAKRPRLSRWIESVCRLFEPLM